MFEHLVRLKIGKKGGNDAVPFPHGNKGQKGTTIC